MRLSAAQPLAALRLRGRDSGERAGAGSENDTEAKALAGDRPKSPRLWPALIACLAIAALTLLLPATPTYDPWAWILWGREITQLDLVTNGGPSWKPLPVVFTTVFALFGDDAAPLLWLWIARAGGLLSLVMAFRLARRFLEPGIAGVVGGVLGAAFLATGYNYSRDAALGNSEPLLAALGLWAFERHLDGRRDHAFYLAFAVALLRPEAWPFLGLYGLWLLVREPAMRLRVVAGGLLIPVLWFGPELWGSGDALRASTRANDPNPQSAAFAAHPGLEVAYRFHIRTIWPIEAAAAVGLLVAVVAFVRERAQKPVLFLAGLGLAWLLLVCVMTEQGYAGNQRYLIATTAAICVLAGIGVGRIFQGIRAGVERLSGNPRLGLAGAAAVFVLALVALIPVISDKVDNTERVLDKLEYEASLWEELPGVIEKAGGRDGLVRCGGVYSGPFQTQMVAYALDLHGENIGTAQTPAPGVAFRTHTVPDGPLVARITDDRFRRITSNRRWIVATAPRADAIGKTCPAAGPKAPRAPAKDYTPELVDGRDAFGLSIGRAPVGATTIFP
ncbi:MAG: hypothetical protein WKF32_03475 [Thermoleophilaceae bacterium]